MNESNYNPLPAHEPRRMKIEPIVFSVSGLNRTEDEEEELESVAV